MVAALVLLSVAVSVVIWSGVVFNDKMEFFENSLKELIAISENGDEAELLSKSKEIVFCWEKSVGILNSMVPHSGFDELSRDILSLPDTVEYTGREHLKEKCIEAINYIESLKSCERVSLKNIF